MSLIKELIDASFVRFKTLSEQSSKQLIATKLIHILIRGNPLIRQRGCKTEVLQQMESQQFSHLLRPNTLHPHINQVIIHPFSRHNQRCQHLTFTYIFLPKLNGKVVIFPIFCCHLLQFGYGNAPVYLIINTLLSHGMGCHTIH